MKYKHKGVTIIELMVSITVQAIMVFVLLSMVAIILRTTTNIELMNHRILDGLKVKNTIERLSFDSGSFVIDDGNRTITFDDTIRVYVDTCSPDISLKQIFITEDYNNPLSRVLALSSCYNDSEISFISYEPYSGMGSELSRLELLLYDRTYIISLNTST